MYHELKRLKITAVHLEYPLFTLAITCLIGSRSSLPLPSIMKQHIPHIGGLGKYQNLKFSFYRMGISLASLRSQKVLSWTIISRGPSVYNNHPITRCAPMWDYREIGQRKLCVYLFLRLILEKRLLLNLVKYVLRGIVFFST